ncbi:O-antigen ligase family protein [Ravibacter arvi]|uniref:O-antigen ligase family protein n=1 Tax=Ravibacter arvi TaxID=2051041 RepID=UPI003CD060F6
MFIYYFSLFLIIPVIAQTFYYYYTHDIISTIKMGNDVLFNTIVFFPFVFLLDRNKLLRAVLILLFLIVSFLSYKRSIIISTLIALVVYYIFVSDIKGKLKGLFKWYVLIFVPVLVYLSTSLFQLIGENVVSRFERLSQDGGNGRNEIYSRLLDIFMESDFLQMLFGHGYMSTRRYIGVLAHNDFIQLLFDFGIVGFSLYLLFFASFIKLIFVKYKRRRYYRVEYATFVSLIVFLLTMTQSNCFIYSPFLLSPMLFLLGILNYRLVNVWK